MKTRILTVLLLISCVCLVHNLSNAQQGWVQQVSGTTNTLQAVSFTDVNTGTVVGSGSTILRTTNGGTSWAPQFSGSGTLYGVSFCDANTGVAVGSSGTILRTTNAGAVWASQKSGYNDLNAVSLVNATTGTAVGSYGTILRTTDGGVTWTTQTAGTTITFRGVCFTDANTGTAVGDGGTILRTTDGGTTWTSQYSSTTNTLYAVDFSDANTGSVVAASGEIFRTTNAGTAWTRQSSGTSNYLYGVSFADANNGISVGSSGTILRTLNGGATWTSLSSGTTNTLYGASLAGVNTGTIVGGSGVVLRATTAADAGATVTTNSAANVVTTSATLNGTINPNGLATTAYFEYGTSSTLPTYSITSTTSQSVGSGTSAVAVTANLTGLTANTTYYYRLVAQNSAGTQRGSIVDFTPSAAQQGWVRQVSGTTNTIRASSFTDVNTGTAVGYGSTILRTTNGGTTWSLQFSGSTSLYGVSFADANNGVAVGSSGAILRTTNGGLTWVSQTSGYNDLNAVSLVNATTGTAVGDYGTILRTTDGGVSWTSQSWGTSITFNGVSFTDANTGTAVGDGGTILRTTNGGVTWTSQYSATTNTLYAVDFSDANTGSVVAASGEIFRTTNAGTTWTRQSSGTSNYLYGVSFADASNGISVGSSGTILRTLNSGATWTSLSSGTTSTFYAVSLAGIYTGTIVGESGIILRATTAADAGATVTTNSATNIAATSATLNGTVNPNGLATTAYFEYGTNSTLAYSVSSTTSQSIGSGTSAVPMTANLTGMTSNATYYYRMVAQNSAGTQRGSIVDFTPSAAQQGWVRQVSGTTNTVYGVSFTDVNAGTAVGGNTTILRTTNGGTTWALQFSGSGTLYGVSFADANNGLAVGYSGAILRTTNAGVTWASQTNGYNGLNAVSLVNATTGTAVGDYGTILRTTDGGVTWTSQTGATSTLRGVCFTDANTGTAVGDGGTILRTTDGGTTWTSQYSSTTNTLYAVDFSDANTGSVVAASGEIFRTTNGGAAWARQSSGTTNYLYGVSFADANNGMAVGSSGIILRTSNGGANWTSQPSVTTSTLYAVSLGGSGAATALGSNGLVFATTGGSAPAVSSSAATGATATSATLNGTVNPNGLATTAYFEWGTSSTLITSTATTSQSMGSGASAISVTANLSGLTANTTYYYRVVGQNSIGTSRGSIVSFTTAALTTVSTGVATSVTSSAATLNGTVNPNGVPATAYFEWGTTSTLTTSTATTSQSIGSGSSAVPVTANLTGLTANTTYYYRMVGQSSSGTSKGSIASFTTAVLVTVTTGVATSVTSSSATLNGTVNPNGSATSAYFEWGANSTLSTYTSSTSQSLGSGTSAVAVTTGVSGLRASTTYYFRMVGQNSAGTQRGPIGNFTTPDRTARSFCVSISGDDINAGTESAPLRNIQTGLTRASDGDTVKVAAGSFTENLLTSVKVVLRGGYADSFSETARSFVGNKSIIRPLAGTALSDGQSSTIDGFVIDGTGGAAMGILVTAGHAIVTHNVVYGISKSAGSGIEVRGSAGTATIMNNTFAYNNLSGGGNIVCGIYVEGNADGTGVVLNNICYGNDVGIEIYSPAPVPTGYNCTYLNDYYNFDGASPAATDFSKDPKFRSATTNDFRLLVGSPCIDAGDPSTPLDLDGTRADIGAYSSTAPPVPPATPVLSSPADNANAVPLTPTVSWGSSLGATKYHLQVSINSAFSSFVVNDSTLTGTSTSFGPLANNKVHYWRVRAGNSTGWSSFSASWSFTTIGSTQPPTITSFTPSRNALSVDKSSSLTLAFNSDINPATLANSTVRINGSLSGLHPGVFSYNSGTRTVTISPNSSFCVGERVTVTATKSILNNAGDSLQKSCTWWFSIKGSRGSGTFTQSSTPAVGTNPKSIAAGDFDRDGDIDIATGNLSSGTVSILLNNGRGSFTQSSTPLVGNYPYSITAADFDRDGDIDLAVANYNSKTLSILMNTGSGAFSQSSTPAATGGPQSITSGDFNGDGAIDLAVANFDATTASIFFNNGNGLFTLNASVVVGSFPKAVTSGDFNGDGYLDLAVAWPGVDSTTILLNNGDGTFAKSSSLGVGHYPTSLAVGDFDGDGDLDIAVGNESATTCSILINNGIGVFTQSSTPTISGSPYSIAPADLDGDGDIDLAVANDLGLSTTGILQNNGGGAFGQSSTTSVGNGPGYIVAGDWDGDGVLDLAVANQNSHTVSVLLNTAIAAPSPLGEYATDLNTNLLLHMNELTGSSVADASGRGGDGVVTGTTITDGRFGKARLFGSSGDSISIPNRSWLNMFSGYTIEAWVSRSGNPSDYETIVAKRMTGSENYGLYIGPTGMVRFQFTLGNANTIYLEGSTAVTNGKWHHVGGSFDSGIMKIYIDGVIQGSKPQSGNADIAIPSVLVGNSSNGYLLHGVVDEIRISNKARSPNEFNLQLPPVNVSAAASGATSNLSWQNGGGAVPLMRYKIYRGTDSTNVTLIDSTTSLFYSSVGLTSGTKYFYRVSPVDSTGFEGVKSYAAGVLISSSLVVVTTAATNITGTSATINGSVNPAGLATTVWFEWGVDSLFKAYSSTSSQSIGSGTSAISVTAGLSTLSQSKKYFYRVVAQNNGGTATGSVMNFTTSAPLPTALTTAAGSITANTAVLNGTVNPSGASTTASFEWGAVSTLPSPSSTTSRSVGAGTSDVAVTDTLSGLSASTTYYYRTVAVNSGGTQKGSIVSFTTKGVGVAPTVTTGSPTSISTTSATLAGSVNPNGASTSVVFQYGTTTSYGSQVTATQSPVSGASAVSVSALLSGLSAGTTHHYRIAATNSAGTTNGPDQTFVSYSTSLTASANVSFPSKAKASDYSATDYKLVGLPGASDLAVNSILTGTRNTDWQAYWDNGAASNYLVEFDGSAAFRFTVGRAFWIISKGALSVSRTVTSGTLNTSQQVEIPLNAGWNLITNPYTSVIAWSRVQTANGINAPIYAYSGSFSTSTSFDPYVGYYLFNGLPNTTLATLKVPYASIFSKTADVKDLVPGDWEVTVLLSAGEVSDGGTSFGVSRQAKSGLDPLDFRKPRGLSTMTAAYFERSEWDSDYPAFATDIRQEVKEVERWDFTVVCDISKPATLRFSGVPGVPSGLEVYLVDEARAKSIDLRRDSTYHFVPFTSASKFSVVVGSMDAIRSKLGEIVPKEFFLSQNFPNPFNPSTSMSVEVPIATMITLKIYNTLGQEVRTLQAGVLQPGRHWFQWDARDDRRNSVPSGAYYCRLTGPEGKSLVTRMLLVK